MAKKPNATDAVYRTSTRRSEYNDLNKRLKKVEKELSTCPTVQDIVKAVMAEFKKR